MKATRTRLPPWLRKRLSPGEDMQPVLNLLKELSLRTVCQDARCPNIAECFGRGTATFMILGGVCTRGCTFCAVARGRPAPPEPGEPDRISEAVRRLGLSHVVVTSVTRDDLPDGGSGHFAQTIRAVHRDTTATVEVLTPDFKGRLEDVDRVLDAAPEVFNHNVETVARLYAAVRPQADYGRSLGVLARAAGSPLSPITKSGLMLGLGEAEDELLAVLADLRRAGCRALTLGQYLAPSAAHRPVAEFVRPERFEQLKARALEMGFEAVASGPFVRSSYKAGRLLAHVMNYRERRSNGRSGGKDGV
ncbi:MAG: lipoyl synthase [Candidatus Brocadiae bacterium]|nr:lipoyl synthase [Candidatus Brocadiia bacterium]